MMANIAVSMLRAGFSFAVALMALCIFLPGNTYAQDTDGDEATVPSRLNASTEICSSVKGAITEGLETRLVVKTAIQLGHKACLVVRCAIDAKGDLGQIVTGAIEAGATSEVVARCTTDAGADPAAVAAFLKETSGKVCYVLTEDLSELVVRDDISPLNQEPPDPPLSPSSF